MRTLAEFNTRRGTVYITTSNKEITKKNISDDLVAKIRDFCRNGMIVFGPVEIKKLRNTRKKYILDVILYRSAEDEIGFHDFRYKNLDLYKKE